MTEAAFCFVSIACESDRCGSQRLAIALLPSASARSRQRVKSRLVVVGTSVAAATVAMSGATSTVSLFDLLAELQRRGIRLSLAGDALEVPAPNDALTPELRARLSSHKADLLALLRRQHANAAPSTPFADAAADGEDALPPILAGFVSAVPAGAEDELPTPGSRFADRLGDLSADERRATLLALVSSSAAEFLELPREAVVPEVALTNLGFNSLMALELRDRLQAALGLRLSVADLWKDLRPVAIAEQLLAAWLLARVTLLAP